MEFLVTSTSDNLSTVFARKGRNRRGGRRKAFALLPNSDDLQIRSRELALRVIKSYNPFKLAEFTSCMVMGYFYPSNMIMT